MRGGGGATEIIAQARAGLSQIATGSYVGTGTYGQNHRTVINCGFKPKMVIFSVNKEELNFISDINSANVMSGSTMIGWQEGISILSYRGSNTMWYAQMDNGLSFYSANESLQGNVSGIRYNWLAIG